MMRRGFWGLVAATLLFFTLPSTAKAAGELELSWDGQTWSEQLSGSLFDPTALWVPGDEATKGFHVRNQAESDGDLTITVVTHDADGLMRHGDVVLSARVGEGDWLELQPNEQTLPLDGQVIPAGESRKVEIKASFDFDSPNRSQEDQLALQFHVTLSDAQVSAETIVPPEEGVDGSGGRLPNTGAPEIGWLIVAGGIAIGAGIALIRGRRREEGGHAAH